MIPINYIGFVNETGYGQAATDVLLALNESGHFDISLKILNGSPSKSFLSDDKIEIFNKLSKKEIDPDSIQIYHCIPPMQMRFPRGKKVIGYATFETFEPPQKWIELLNRLNGAICPSLFNYNIFSHAGLKNSIFYIPHCLDFRIWNDSVCSPKTKSFSFLFFGTWRKRKGWPQLIEAYFREFCDSDDVSLVIKTDKHQVALEDIEKIKYDIGINKKYPNIIIEKRIFKDIELPYFFKSFNCLIMPTLGEGFGLPALQCMAVKIPIIITNFSGCQDYAKENFCTLIEPNGFMLHNNMDNIAQFENKKWPRIEIQSIQNAMRQAYSSENIIKAKADKAYEFVQDNFSYNRCVNCFKELAETINSVN